MPSGFRLFLIPVVLAAACLADDATSAKPECNAQNLHKIWPEKADRRSGVPVEICVEKHLRYRWQALTVDISELRAQAKSNGKLAKEAPAPASRE
jgi:hypothetical protein